jgi:hypothetical protein
MNELVEVNEPYMEMTMPQEGAAEDMQLEGRHTQSNSIFAATGRSSVGEVLSAGSSLQGHIVNLFVIDNAATQAWTQGVAVSFRAMLDSLHPHAYIALVTFSDVVRLWDLGGDSSGERQPHVLQVPILPGAGSGGYSPGPSSVGTPGEEAGDSGSVLATDLIDVMHLSRLFAKVGECRPHVEKVLDQMCFAAEEKARRTSLHHEGEGPKRGFGSTLQALLDLFEDAGMERAEDLSQGGGGARVNPDAPCAVRTFCMLSGITNYGRVGHLDPARYSGHLKFVGEGRGIRDGQLLLPQSDFYAAQARRAHRLGVTLNLHFPLLNGEFVDLASMVPLCEMTGGNLHLYSTPTVGSSSGDGKTATESAFDSMMANARAGVDTTDSTSVKIHASGQSQQFLHDHALTPPEVFGMLGADLGRAVSQPFAARCILRVRTSPEFHVSEDEQGYFGAMEKDEEYDNMWHITGCDSHRTFGFDFEFGAPKLHNPDDPDTIPTVQMAFAFTEMVPINQLRGVFDREEFAERHELIPVRRVRVYTLQCDEVANVPSSVIKSVDRDAVLAILTYKVVKASLLAAREDRDTFNLNSLTTVFSAGTDTRNQGPLKEARRMLCEWLIRFFACYNAAFSKPQSADGIDVQCSHVEAMDGLISYVFGLFISQVLYDPKEMHVHPDLRTYLRCMMTTLPPERIRAMLYPTMYAFSKVNEFGAQHIKLNRESMTFTGGQAFVVDAGTSICVYCGVGAELPPADCENLNTVWDVRGQDVDKCLLVRTMDLRRRTGYPTPYSCVQHAGRGGAALERYLLEDQDDLTGNANSFFTFQEFILREVAKTMGFTA